LITGAATAGTAETAIASQNHRSRPELARRGPGSFNQRPLTLDELRTGDGRTAARRRDKHLSQCVKLRDDDDRATPDNEQRHGAGGTAMSDAGLVLVALAIAVGIVGVVLPVLPGALLAWAAIAVWALAVGSAIAWVVLAIATLSIGLAQVVKVLVPGRRLRDAGVPRMSILAGLLLAIAGFFLIPIVGLFIGFPLGVYLQERRRLGQHEPAWRSTHEALRAIGLSIAIELAATLVATGAWLVAVLT
jgi:uncharacterized protein YqgC (DUF456 family)